METQAQIGARENHPRIKYLYFHVACLLLVVVSIGWLMRVELQKSSFYGIGGDGIRVTLDYRKDVFKREPFAVLVRVENDSGRFRHVESIYIPRRLAAGVVFWDSEPHFKSEDYDRQGMSFAYDIAIPPRQSVSIALKGSAMTQGAHDGYVQVWIAESESIHQEPLRFTVADSKSTH